METVSEVVENRRLPPAGPPPPPDQDATDFGFGPERKAFKRIFPGFFLIKLLIHLIKSIIRTLKIRRRVSNGQIRQLANRGIGPSRAGENDWLFFCPIATGIGPTQLVLATWDSGIAHVDGTSRGESRDRRHADEDAATCRPMSNLHVV